MTQYDDSGVPIRVGQIRHFNHAPFNMHCRITAIGPDMCKYSPVKYLPGSIRCVGEASTPGRLVQASRLLADVTEEFST